MDHVIFKTKDYIPEGEQITLMFNSEPRNPLMHCHEFWELSYVYKSVGFHNSENERIPVEDGNILLTPPYAVHGMSSIDNVSAPKLLDFVCLFTEDYFKKLYERIQQIVDFKNSELFVKLLKENPENILLKDDGSVKEGLWRCEKEYNFNLPGKDIVIENLFCNVLISITRIYESYNYSASLSNLNRKIEILTRYMRNNLSRKITLDELSNLIHLSPDYLCRFFKQKTGDTLFNYLRSLRMERAKQLLSNAAYSIAYISSQCGYPYTANFQQAFKKYSGCTPSEYRKHIINGLE